MAKYDFAVLVLDVLIEPNTGASLGEHRGERGLADLERVAAQVVAVELELGFGTCFFRCQRGA